MRTGCGARRRASSPCSQLLPVIEAAAARDLFDDPFAEGAAELRPALVLLDEHFDDPVLDEQCERLRAAAQARDVRIETVSTEATTDVARYASLLLSGTYAAEYLRLGLVTD